MDQIGLLFFAGMLLVMWLFFIRPQAKQAKLGAEFQKNLQKGDKVVTSGGVHGKVVKADESNASILLEIDANVKVKIDRSAISMDLTKAAYGEKKTDVTEAKA
jgi:preprotein translocase subunit YajC